MTYVMKLLDLNIATKEVINLAKRLRSIDLLL